MLRDEKFFTVLNEEGGFGRVEWDKLWLHIPNWSTCEWRRNALKFYRHLWAFLILDLNFGIIAFHVRYETTFLNQTQYFHYRNISKVCLNSEIIIDSWKNSQKVREEKIFRLVSIYVSLFFVHSFLFKGSFIYNNAGWGYKSFRHPC